MKKETIVEGLFVVLGLAFLISGAVAFSYQFYTMHKMQDTNKYSQGDEAPFDVPEKYNVGFCVDETMNASIAVYVVEEFADDEKQGGYYSSESAIVLKNGHASVEVVAHEVSHLVDDIVRKKGIRDDETRAYLQGYFTQCVNDLKWGLITISLEISPQ